MHKRRLIGFLLACMLLAACGGGSGTQQPATQDQASAASGTANEDTAGGAEKVTLRLWIFEGEEEFLPELKKAFEAKYPNIALEITDIPEDQYVTKIDTALAANDPPDIGFVYGGEQRWLKADKFLPLDEMITDKQINLEDYNKGAMSYYCYFDGKTYCLGSYMGGIVLVYNKDMFDAAGVPYPSPTEPMTIAEYAALAEKLTKKSDKLEERIWGGTGGVTWWWADWRTHFSEDGHQAEGHINDDATVQAYSTMAKLVTDGVAPSASDVQAMGDANLFAQKKQAMAWGSPSDVATFEEQGVRYGAAPVLVETKGDKPWVTAWTDAFGVFSQSEHPKEAQEFVAFLGTEGNRMRVKFGLMPLNMKLAEELKWAGDNAGRSEMLQAIGTARESVFVPGVYTMMAPIDDAFNAILEGQAPKEALDEAALQIQESLDQAWETWEQIQ